MFDHCYNLLRLRPSSAVATEFPAPGVPDGFVVPQLGGGLTAVRSELFGTDPDAMYCEYRMRQYMGLLHAGRFADHVESYDRRITYGPLLRMPAPTPGAVVSPIGHDRSLRAFGVVTADDGLGSSINRWLIVATTSNPPPTPTSLPNWPSLLPWPLHFSGTDGSGTLKSGRLDDPTMIWNPLLPAPFHFNQISSGSLRLSTLLPFPFHFNQTEDVVEADLLTAKKMPAGDLISGDALEPLRPLGSTIQVATLGVVDVGNAWLLTTVARPAKGLVEVLRGVEALGEGPLKSLFGSEDVEPYVTYRNLFHDSDQLPERLTGVLLALARRTDDARRAA